MAARRCWHGTAGGEVLTLATRSTVDELAAVGLDPLPSRLVRPPRVKGSPVHFECRLHQIVRLPGHQPSSEHHVVIGKVVAVHIDDDVLTTDGRIDIPRIRPIARLGYKDYAVVEAMFQMETRTPEDVQKARPPDGGQPR